MKKKHTISLSVPTPCHEDWDNMTASEQGRHCASCNKTVIDFSLYADRELIEFFKKTNGKVCGNFMPYQLDRTILVTEQNNRSFFYKLFLGSALASWLGLASSADAQTSHAVPQLTLQQNSTSQHTHALTNAPQSTPYNISGKVTNTQKTPLSNVMIELIDTNGSKEIETVYTDSTGNFNIPIPEKYLGQTMLLTAWHSGYSSPYNNFVVEKTNTMNIELHNQPMLRGEVRKL